MASNARPMTPTPPDRLISTFTFRSSETTLSTNDEAGPSRVPLRQTTLINRTHQTELTSAHTDIEVKEWKGRVVFTDTVPLSPSTSTAHHPPSASALSDSTPAVGSTPARQTQGSFTSPISVSSDSDLSPEKLPRPRGKPIYTTKISSTAYTPPRPFHLVGTTASTSTSSTNDTLGSSIPVHPFFAKGISRSKSTPPPAPPPSQRPRLVAYYSSTSASASSSQTQEASQESTWIVSGKREIELVGHTLEPYRAESPTEYSGSEEEVEQIENKARDGSRGKKEKVEADAREEELDSMMRTLGGLTLGKGKGKETPGRNVSKLSARRALGTPTRLPVKFRSISTMPQATDPPKAVSVASKTTTAPTATKPHRPTWVSTSKPSSSTSSTFLSSLQPAEPISVPTAPTPLPLPSPDLPSFSYKSLSHPPKVVYTTDLDEANDLLSCLQGDIIGFDLEWPTNFHQGPDGEKAGHVVDPKTGKTKFTQPRVGLMQFCDEKMVVLVQVWSMDKIPIKAVEILQDPKRYKLGVQIRGDGQKMLRDHGKQFPKGIASLLELSSMARRAEPILLGPGNVLISLAKLIAAFLGKNLSKGSARTSNWAKPLKPIQVEYAANDVVCAVELFKELRTRAEKNGIKVDLDACCANLGGAVGQRSVSPKTKRPSSPSIEDFSDAQPSIPGIAPREQRAFEMFKSGMTSEDMAEHLGIKLGTVHGYICAALTLLPVEALSVDGKNRLLDEIPKDSYSRKNNRSLFRRLRTEVGEQDISDSETEQ